MQTTDKKQYETPELKAILFANRGDFLDGSGEKTQNDSFADPFGQSF